MVKLYKVPCPSIFYMPIRPSDLEVVDKLHADLFPNRYESEFFLNVVHGRDIVSWGAVDRNRSDGHSDELVGFVTTRLVMAKGSEWLIKPAKRIGTHYFRNEWQELYWNSHIQKCISVAAEKVVLPYFEGCLGEIKIPDSILLSMGYKQCGSYLNVDYSKLSYHCQHFGLYARLSYKCDPTSFIGLQCKASSFRLLFFFQEFRCDRVMVMDAGLVKET